MVIEGIEIHFDEDEGHLRLDCGDEEFNHVRDVVIAQASAADHLSPFIDGIRSIAVRRILALRDTAPRRFGRGFRILLVSLALSISLTIQVVGMFAIARWLWGLGS
jgi:hypothetical protein